MEERERLELRQLVRQAQAKLTEVEARLGRGHSLPVLSARERTRVEKVGEIAHLHLAHIEEHGRISLSESRELRRRLAGGDARGTASLFGTRRGGNILYRKVTSGTPMRDDQDVGLTEAGMRVAQLYRQVHGLE